MLPDVAETTKEELTTFDFVEPLSNVDLSTTDSIPRAPTTTQFEISNIFARPRLLGSFTFHVGSSTANQYMEPYHLIDDDVLGSYAAMFAFMKWTHITLTFVSRSNPMQYGCVFIMYIPYLKTSFYSEFANIVDYNPTVLDITSQEEVKITVPWHAPTKYVRTGLLGTPQHTYRMGNIAAVVYVPLDSTDANALEDVITDVYVAYHGVQFFGPAIRSDTLQAQRLKMQYQKIRARIQGQMNPIADAVEGLGRRVVDWGASKIVNKLGAITADEVAQAAYSWWSGSPEQKEMPTREAKFETFNNDAAFGDKSLSKTLADCRESTPVSMDTTKHSFLELIMRPSLYPYGCGAFSSTNTSVVMCLHPRWPVGFPVQGVTTPAQFATYMGNGYLSYMAQFFNQYRGGIKLRFMFLCNSFVSGRIRISLSYGDDQSSMPSVMPYNQNCPTKFVQVKGVTYCEMTISQCVLYDWISLTTGREMTPWIHVSLDGGVLSSGNGTRTPTIQYYTWWAAAEDFQFRMLSSIGQGTPYAPTPVMEGQMMPWRDFEKPFEKFGDVMEDSVQTSSDQPRYIEDLLTRFSEAVLTDPNVSSSFITGGSNEKSMFNMIHYCCRVNSLDNANNTGQASLFDAICCLYMWNSGTIDWKIAVEDDEANPIPKRLCVGRVTGTTFDGTPTFYPDPDKPDTGTVTIDTTQWRILDFSTPFIGQFPWDTQYENFHTIDPLPNTVQCFGQGWIPTSQTIWKKAGFDFQVTQLLPPPTKIIWPMYTYYDWNPSVYESRRKDKNHVLKPFPTWKNRMIERAGNAVTSMEEMQPATYQTETTTTSLSDESRI